VTSGQEPRLGLQPFVDDTGAQLAIGGPFLREAVIDEVVALNPVCVLDDRGGAVAVVAANGLLKQVGPGYASLCLGRQVNRSLTN
jgi:hypothetical protein